MCMILGMIRIVSRIRIVMHIAGSEYWMLFCPRRKCALCRECPSSRLLQCHSFVMPYLTLVHACTLLHRRLGVRNVLLQQQANGFIAKLIGFGPLSEDVDSAYDKSGAGVSPVLSLDRYQLPLE